MLPCLILAAMSQTSRDITLTPGMGPIRSSVKIKTGVYTLADWSGKGAVQIGADNVVVDFQGATIQSPASSTGRQETFNGIGIAVNGHKNITIRRVHVHGFQYNVKLLQSSGVSLLECELGESRAQKIMEGERVNSIWLDLRGLDAWRSYGAGAWIEKCSHCTVDGMRANQSQNGLVLVNSSKNRIYGCDLSYNSGWGIALCRSSDNLICWNHADFVNRPWAGFWGGDSSGVVLTTSSHRNIWAYNSFTHSGDGFFLATLNGGFDAQGKLHEEGPCDGNWVSYNDGSWSTANAFESTFSEKNYFLKNLCDYSNYGFWLGYSFRNTIWENQIIGSHADGIATEQGANNTYYGNDLEQTGAAAIHLWGGVDPKYRQSPSQENMILNNRIVKAKLAFDLTNSDRDVFLGNIVRDAALPPKFSQKGATIDGQVSPEVPRMDEVMALKPVGFRMYRDADLPTGWQWLAPSAYGTRDYRKMMVPWDMKDARTIRIFLRSGPAVRIELPDWLEMTQGPNKNEWWVAPKPDPALTGEYRPFKIQTTDAAGKTDWIAGTILDLKWHVRWFKWFRNDHSAYADSDAWAKLFAGPPLKEEDLPDLPQIPGYQAPEPGLPIDHFALVGTTSIKLDAGKYRFDSISDDGIQVFVDDKKIIDNWTHHGATADTGEIKLPAGVHAIKVHYCQEDGGAALSLTWSKK